MTLEAVVYQQQRLLGHNNDLCSLLENWGWDFNFPKQEQPQEHTSPNQLEEDHNFTTNQSDQDHDQISSQWVDLSAAAPATSSSTRPKRRRGRSTRRNQEDIENQRMAHIAVERNRRKQMNEYLSVLKSFMPHSYSQRGDQASIVGGAINVVKELEQNLHWLSAHKMQMTQEKPFGEFFTFPQYSTTTNPDVDAYSEASRVADVEATMVESHVNLKIRSKKRPKQLLKLVSGIQEMSLTILHLNVITADPFVLYSLSVKVEDENQLSSADEIAAAVHQLLSNIDEEEEEA